MSFFTVPNPAIKAKSSAPGKARILTSESFLCQLAEKEQKKEEAAEKERRKREREKKALKEKEKAAKQKPKRAARKPQSSAAKSPLPDDESSDPCKKCVVCANISTCIQCRV